MELYYRKTHKYVWKKAGKFKFENGFRIEFDFNLG